MARRAQLVAEVIQPALARGDIVVSDRFLLANVVYQGHAGGLAPQAIWDIGRLSTGGLEPALTLVLDLPAGVGIGRIADRAHDSFEQMGLAFHERVRAGYLEIAREEKDRVAVVAGDQGEEEIRKAIRALVEERLGEVLRGD